MHFSQYLWVKHVLRIGTTDAVRPLLQLPIIATVVTIAAFLLLLLIPNKILLAP